MIQRLALRIEGSGFRIWDSCLGMCDQVSRIWGLGFEVGGWWFMYNIQV
jgi:hypothetical protein